MIKKREKKKSEEQYIEKERDPREGEEIDRAISANQRLNVISHIIAVGNDFELALEFQFCLHIAVLKFFSVSLLLLFFLRSVYVGKDFLVASSDELDSGHLFFLFI